MANGTPNPDHHVTKAAAAKAAEQQVVQIFETRTLHMFHWDVEPNGAGGVTLMVTMVDGKRIALPFDNDGAKACGHKMAAPRIEAA